MTQHTPGPWTIDPRADTHVFGRNQRHVCTTGGYASTMPADRDTYIDENAANARLIAAAPDLLAALKAITGLGVIPSTQPEYEMLRAAVAKATGES